MHKRSRYFRRDFVQNLNLSKDIPPSEQGDLIRIALEKVLDQNRINEMTDLLNKKIASNYKDEYVETK